MRMWKLAEQFAWMIEAATTIDELWTAMCEITAQMGFDYFALFHHIDRPRITGRTIRMHNYPRAWADYFEEQRQAVSDPVHRATYMTNAPFPWSELKNLISISAGDTAHLLRAYALGIVDGFTIPANIPGETNGSCSFAIGNGRELPHHWLPIAQWLGAKAFHRAREILKLRDFGVPPPKISERQLDCLLLLSRGKTAEEIAMALGRGRETVVTQLKKLRDVYGVYDKTSLVTHALKNGTLCFDDAIP